MERLGVRILLLDDEPFILKLHTHLLKELGFASIRAFESGAMALADLDLGRTPDLILLDLSMPEMDGIQFIRELVDRKYAGRLILISGEDKRLLQTASRLVQAHGIDILGHLPKPVSASALQGLIDGWEERTSFIPRGPGRIYTADEIRAALRAGEIISHYQPKVSVQTGAVAGVESLARWRHPSDGLVGPDRFIGVAEQHAFIDELTMAIFRGSLEDIKDLEVEGRPLSVAINLTVASLNVLGFADFAAQETARAAMSPSRVTLEVTESQLMSDLRAPLEVLSRLRLMRFKLSIDDFGTGYSSLAQLRDIPFDELKIDQSFVHRASADPTARAIYDASLGLARQLGIGAVAEGVEDRSDWDLVRSTGCDTAQGYFVARPMPASALPEWIEAWRARTRAGFGT